MCSKGIGNPEAMRNNGKSGGENSNAFSFVPGDITHVLISQIASLVKAYESVKRLNRQFQSEMQLLTSHNKVTEKKLSVIVEILDSEKSKNQHYASRINVLEDKNTEMGIINEDLLNRIQALELNSSDLVNAIESDKLFHSEVLSKIGILEENTSEVQSGLASINMTVTQVVENMSSLEDNEICMSSESASESPKETRTAEPEEWTTTNNVNPVRVTTSTPKEQKSCKGVLYSGVYEIFFPSLVSMKSVYCDTVTDGGGWVVIMRRQDGSVSFNRTWMEYKTGFGTVTGEFWIGNEFLHEMTSTKSTDIRIDMRDFNGNTAFAKYEGVSIGSEADKFSLNVSGYSGSAGDSMILGTWSGGIHNGKQFSTMDSDNDLELNANCARKYFGGWWFHSCFSSHLTGVYSHKSRVEWAYGVIWSTWKNFDESLKFVEMKIR